MRKAKMSITTTSNHPRREDYTPLSPRWGPEPRVGSRPGRPLLSQCAAWCRNVTLDRIWSRIVGSERTCGVAGRKEGHGGKRNQRGKTDRNSQQSCNALELALARWLATGQQIGTRCASGRRPRGQRDRRARGSPDRPSVRSGSRRDPRADHVGSTHTIDSGMVRPSNCANRRSGSRDPRRPRDPPARRAADRATLAGGRGTPHRARRGLRGSGWRAPPDVRRVANRPDRHRRPPPAFACDALARMDRAPSSRPRAALEPPSSRPRAALEPPSSRPRAALEWPGDR